MSHNNKAIKVELEGELAINIFQALLGEGLCRLNLDLAGSTIFTKLKSIQD